MPVHARNPQRNPNIRGVERCIYTYAKLARVSSASVGRVLRHLEKQVVTSACAFFRDALPVHGLRDGFTVVRGDWQSELRTIHKWKPNSPYPSVLYRHTPARSKGAA